MHTHNHELRVVWLSWIAINESFAMDSRLCMYAQLCITFRFFFYFSFFNRYSLFRSDLGWFSIFCKICVATLHLKVGCEENTMYKQKAYTIKHLPSRPWRWPIPQLAKLYEVCSVNVAFTLTEQLSHSPMTCNITKNIYRFLHYTRTTGNYASFTLLYTHINMENNVAHHTLGDIYI